MSAGNVSGHPDSTLSVGDALVKTRALFQKENLDTASLDARLLVCAAAGIGHADMIARPERQMSAEEVERLGCYRSRRLKGEPVSRILGEREFWSRSFEIGPDVLDPRPDTETLVELSLAHLERHRKSAPRVLDLGTGSGCLVVTLLCELEQAEGFAIDRSFEALCVARRNAMLHGVGDRCHFLCADWATSVAGRFDLVDILISINYLRLFFSMLLESY